MLKAILIDDERPALRELEYFLKEYEMIEIAGMFTNPLEGIEKTATIKPQIVFLDINMPKLRGIDAASKILDLCPDTDIIFVTAYDQYAIEAFELHALDYVLKPVSKERFARTMRHVMNMKKTALVNNQQMRLKIKCFGRFEIGFEGQEPIKWRTEKTKELFAYLLHNKGVEMTKEQLIDNLWKDCDIEKATRQLHNGIYHIRKTLNRYGIDRTQISINGIYCLNTRELEMDVDQFNQLISQNREVLTVERLETIYRLYSGEYFENADWMWVEGERTKLLQSYIESLCSLCENYMSHNELKKPEAYLNNIYNKNPYEEDITALLIKLYLKAGNKAKAKKHYMNFASILKKELGIKPQESIQRMVEDL